MHHRAPRNLLPALLLLTLAASGCGNSDGDDTGAASESSGATTMAMTAAASTGNADTSTTAATESVTSSSTTTPDTGDTTLEPTDTGSESTGAPAEGCDSYCATITMNCGGEFTQYGSPEMCQGACAAFPPGVPGEMANNTLACRSYHAEAAAMANDVHCTHAGPGGDGACGSNCEGFCGIAGKYCPEAWADTDACLTACAGFNTAERYDASDIAGDTFACRLYHLTAATIDPATHCGHIKGDSPVCM